MKALLTQTNQGQEESHWLSVSDLMAGLMMVFLFISIALMLNVYNQKNKIEQEKLTITQIADTYKQTQSAIYNALYDEFKEELTAWGATINKATLTVTFQSPNVFFASGDTTPSEKYQQLLNSFFPRYLQVLNPYRSSILEIRVEGHTSSAWEGKNTDEAYFYNMALSQTRTRSVLSYVYQLEDSAPYRDWIKSNIAAVGLSSSKLIYTSSGKENPEKSRRVNFRVITNADKEIQSILDASQ